MTIKDLIEKRAKVWETAKNFVETHEDKNGVLSDEDTATYNKMEKEIEDLTAAIDRQQRAERREAELAKPVNSPITGKPFMGDTKEVKKGRASDAYKDAMLSAMRSNFRNVSNVLQEGVDADGGYLVPEEYDRRLIDVLDGENIMRSLAEDYEIEDLGIAKSYGLEVLIKVMGEALPDELMDTLQHVQIACLEEKKRRAQAAVATAAVAAAGEGAAPIPFSDCALLIPTQVGMIASITVIFGFDVNRSIITALLSSSIGAGGATLLGKTVVTNIIKFIPGAGTVIGGAISAGTAGVITAALGEAYIGIMELVFKGEMSIDDLGTKKGKDAMSTMFKEQLKIKK